MVVVVAAAVSFASEWVALGPDGGDARSLAVDPANPNHIFLGTSAGEVFVSQDGGGSWARWSHIGTGYDLVVDHVEIDPTDTAVMYAGVWSIESNGGGVYKSSDHGKTWKSLTGIEGKSVRALGVAPSDPKVIGVGALDGVYRSKDAGATWERISPASSGEIRNVESIAFDPKSVDTVYVGTWHLPWKTSDGGKTWTNIKQGIIDDSDVFSIIVDHNNPAIVYVSACSGIYKSESAGNLFKKVQGIPFAARRTRVLQQDPANANVIYAGTTEGLWKTTDSGATWARVSSPNLIVNDVVVNPKEPNTVLLATDRTGVMMSKEAGVNLRASNRGFSHRQVSSVVVDASDSSQMYTALINNRELGGVFVSKDAGQTWWAMNTGMGPRDVFALESAADGTLIAGTNNGFFSLAPREGAWKPMNTILTEKVTTVRLRAVKKGKPRTKTKREWLKSQFAGRVAQVKLLDGNWYAATSQGFYRSLDAGKSWTGGPVLGEKQIVSVDAHGSQVLIASRSRVLWSKDFGVSWEQLQLPQYVTRVYSVALAPQNELWIVTQMGAFRTTDGGSTWEHEMVGSPMVNINYIRYDTKGKRLIGVAGPQVFQSTDGGRTWAMKGSAGYPIRNVSISNGRLLGVTEFNGVVAQPILETTRLAAGGGK